MPRAAPRWLPPVVGHMKLNVDGVVAKVQNKGDVGVVCRNKQGKFQSASAVVFVGIIDPETLEALACCEAISLDEDLGLQKLHISTYC